MRVSAGEYLIGSIKSDGGEAPGLSSAEMQHAMDQVLEDSLRDVLSRALKDARVGLFTNAATFKQSLDK